MKTNKSLVKSLGGKSPKTCKDGLPEWWPVLEPGDIGVGRYSYFDGSPCCSAGWLSWLCCRKASIENVLIKSLEEERGLSGVGLVELSDNATPEQRTKAWNLTGKKLGYEIE